MDKEKSREGDRVRIEEEDRKIREGGWLEAFQLRNGVVKKVK